MFTDILIFMSLNEIENGFEISLVPAGIKLLNQEKREGECPKGGCCLVISSGHLQFQSSVEA